MGFKALKGKKKSSFIFCNVSNLFEYNKSFSIIAGYEEK